ncbi:U2 small nuclear ribonucleoprotein B'', partial [Smittium mucronatum]
GKRAHQSPESPDPAKKPRSDGFDTDRGDLPIAGMDVEESGAGSEPDSARPATNTLFLENLPEAVTTEMLATLFQQYPGFKQVRRVPGKNNLAFVDYDSPDQASISLNILQGFKLTPENPMSISFC